MGETIAGIDPRIDHMQRASERIAAD